ncbi:MAG: PIG-L deacetylase family protein [Acidimicrobiales bacterium]
MTEAQNPLTPGAVPLVETSRNLPTPERALAIGAHPDDVDFGCGGTLAKWAAAGCEVSVLVCTDGSKGTWDPQADEAELIERRKVEQRAAAEALGATGEVVFLGHPDGELASTLTEREQVTLWIRRLRPTVVLGHDPWKRYRLHPDHRHAGWLTTDGVVAARDPKFFPHQGVPHHRPDRLLLWEADAPDHVEDVTGWLDTKYAALLAHESQFETTMLEQTVEGTVGADSPEMAAFRARVEAKLTAAGDAAGVTHAEVFKLIDDL